MDDGSRARSLLAASIANGSIPGQELWDASYSAPDEETSLSGRAVITHRRNVYATGQFGEAYVAVAYDEDGQLLWDREVDGVEPRGLIARKRQVFVVGNQESGDPDMIDVTAFDAATGATQWSKHVDINRQSIPGQMAAFRGKLYVAGVVESPASDLTFRAFLQIYNAADGAEIDNVVLDEESRFSAVAVKGNTVFVAGSADATAATRGRIEDGAFLVQARHGDTLEILWEQRVNLEGRSDYSRAVIAKGKRVYVAGRTDEGGGVDGLLVAALDAVTGEEL